MCDENEDERVVEPLAKIKHGPTGIVQQHLGFWGQPEIRDHVGGPNNPNSATGFQSC